MKLFALLAGSALASTIALPAAAQGLPNLGFLDPAALAQKAYVEVDGGDITRGALIDRVAATGLGTSKGSARFQDDFFGGALAGYTLVKGVSMEAEGVYARTHYNFASTEPEFGTAGAIRTYGGLGNLKLSLPLTTHFTRFGIQPYVAGGIGYGKVEYNGINGAFAYQSQESGFMWQGKAGVEVDMGRHLALDVAYRYLETPEYDTPGSYSSGTGYSALARSHLQAVTLGLKFNF